MDAARKKQLLEEYKHRRPEMGVIRLRCAATGESFLGLSNDLRADFSSVQAKLSMRCHPNKRLQALWDEYGADGFALDVAASLKYDDDPKENHTAALEELREKCFAADPAAQKIWR